MRINNNITALNAHRQYGINNSNIGKSVEKLSSGYRINRAGDDAAGLAISEKMRAQIRGLNMASKNSQDAVSLVQTAEGALQSTHNVLQRMRELAVQSASDTNETGIDRAALQQEFMQLQEEINDISTSTRFNDQNLLDGTFQSKQSGINTSETSLKGINNLSVVRAEPGNYTMTIKTNEEVESSVIPGVPAKIPAGDLDDLAKMSAKMSGVSFSGFETSAHNGNTYTLKISGAEVSNMTFQLLDSNNRIISTAQNVDTSGWSDKSTNTVNFQGVGTFTFAMNAGEQVTGVNDLESMSGAKLSFTDSGKVTSATDNIALKTTPAPTGVAGLSFVPSENITYADGDYTISMSITAAASADPVITVTVAGSSGSTVAMQTVPITRGAGEFTVNIPGIGEFTLNTNAQFGAPSTSAMTIDSAALLDPSPASLKISTAAYTNTIEPQTITTTAASFANLAISYEPGTYTFTSASAPPATPPSITIAATTGGKHTITITEPDGTAATFSATFVTLPAGSTTEIELGKYGKLLLKATALYSAASASETFDLTVKSDEIKAGVDAIATNTVRASMDLTINGETVKLHKGDTYANFADLGIAFEFNALSDKDIANSEFFGNIAQPPSTEAKVTIGVSRTTGASLVIQTGANEGDSLSINIDCINTSTLGINFSNISTQAAAESAITEVNNAINKVSEQRATLGALQNRLEYKISNLDTSAENLLAAESRIRDVDMAKEMTQFTKNNILAQASTAMLAQANSLPQGVLQLLGG